MPCISGSYNPSVGPLIHVAVLPPQYFPHSQLTPLATPQNPSLVMVLIDTGASMTCVSANAAQAAGLQSSGQAVLSGSTGQGPVNQYTSCVGFLINAIQDPTGRVSGQLNMHLVQGCEFANQGFGFDVLLGRDIICKGSFSCSFDGHFILSF